MHQKLCGVKKNEFSPLKRQHQLEEMLHARQMLKQALKERSLKLGLEQRQPLASWNWPWPSSMVGLPGTPHPQEYL